MNLWLEMTDRSGSVVFVRLDEVMAITYDDKEGEGVVNAKHDVYDVTAAEAKRVIATIKKVISG